MTDKEIRQFVKERNEAFIDFVKTNNAQKFMKYAKKYGIPVAKK